MNDCFYCENGEKLNSLMIEVCKLDYSTVYLNRDQKHKGRCIVMFKDHKTEYFQLTQEENRGYFAELAKTAQLSGTCIILINQLCTLGRVGPCTCTRGSQIQGRTSVGRGVP